MMKYLQKYCSSSLSSKRSGLYFMHRVSSSYSSSFSTSTTSFSPSSSSSSSSSYYDPISPSYKFWNREEYKNKGKYDYLIKISPESIKQQANIISLANDVSLDDANEALYNKLPYGSKLLKTGMTLEDFDNGNGDEITNINPPNVLFVSPSCVKARYQIPLILEKYPTIEWIHVRSAGIDFIVSDELSSIITTNNKNIKVTNAKGQFSSSLAEYTMMACSYFAKDLPRLMKQKSNKQWCKYDVEELRGKTLGIVGYGDIGRACAKLAHVYGMKIVALRRNPKLSSNDPYCEVTYGTDKESLNRLMSESDYIVCSAPSTVETRGMVNKDAFEAVKPNAVFINLGRGPVVDEEAMIEALKNGRLKGAALDVFKEEPLPKENELWSLENVLLSPRKFITTVITCFEC